MFATAFAPAFSALSIPIGLIPQLGQAARNNAIAELDKCAELLNTNTTLMPEDPALQ